MMQTFSVRQSAAGEDPSLFMDNRNNWHCLFHRSPFDDPDIAIGHSWSPDGYSWFTSGDAAANSTISSVQFGPVVHGKRERPHLFFSETGSPRAFVTGVGITPFCNPLSDGVGWSTSECASATQYYHLDANSPGPGWYDSTYTLVQGVL